MQAAAGIHVHSFLLLSVIHDVDVPQFNHSPMEGHLGCFQFGAVINKPAMKICVVFV